MILKILRTGFVLDEKILMSLSVMLTFCLSSSKEFLCTKSTENIFKILTVAEEFSFRVQYYDDKEIITMPYNRFNNFNVL